MCFLKYKVCPGIGVLGYMVNTLHITQSLLSFSQDRASNMLGIIKTGVSSEKK